MRIMTREQLTSLNWDYQVTEYSIHEEDQVILGYLNATYEDLIITFSFRYSLADAQMTAYHLSSSGFQFNVEETIMYGMSHRDDLDDVQSTFKEIGDPKNFHEMIKETCLGN